MRIAFIFPSIPTRNDRETDLRRAVIEKKDWLGQEAESVKAALDQRHPGSAVSVHIMYTKSGHAVADEGVEWFATKPMWPMTRRKFYQGKQWSRAFMRKILDWKPDLVHWQMNSYAYTFHLAARSLVKHGIPYVYQHHGPHLARKGYIRKILQYPHEHAAKGIYLTRYHEEMYRQGLHLDPAKNCIIRVGYDERFQPLDRAACKEKTGFKGEPILFWAAGITKRKDPLTVLRAYETVAPEFPKSHFYIAGSGLIDEEVDALIAGSPTLQKYVTRLGYVNNALLPEMENAADIYVMGSHGEGFCVSSMEAMACGLFPVLTTVPCFVEQTDNGRLGELFEAGNVQQCAQCLRKAIGDVDRRESVRREMPETVRTLTWGYAANQLVDLYEEVLAKRSSK